MRNKSHFLFRGCFAKWVYNALSNRVLLLNKKIIININLKIGYTVQELYEICVEKRGGFQC